MMGKITDVTLADTANKFVAMIPSADSDKQTFEEAAKQDPIALGGAVVWSIHASGQHCQNFEETIKDGDVKHWFGTNLLLLCHFFSFCEMSRQDGIQFTA